MASVSTRCRRIGSTASGLSRSFQITSIFHRLSVFENLRCALLWSRGYRYSFWSPLWRQKALNEQPKNCWKTSISPAGAMCPPGCCPMPNNARLEIGMTIAGGASVILLDEPTAGMSNTETDYAMALIRRLTQGKTLVMVEHDMKVVFDLADTITVLVYGQVIASVRRRPCGPTERCRKPTWGRLSDIEDIQPWRPATRPAGPRICTPITGRATSCMASISMSTKAKSSRYLGGTVSAGPPPARRSWDWCRRKAGSSYRGRDLAGLRSDLVARAGIGYVPEDRQVFPTLSVRQNLELGLKRAGRFGRWTFDDVFRLFPNLAERQHNPAGVLSGGEQQMLTMCRTLMGDPDLILIDEPTEGLAPLLVEQVGVLLAEIASRGVAILLVEQKLTIALKISHGCTSWAMARSCSRDPRRSGGEWRVRREWLEV